MCLGNRIFKNSNPLGPGRENKDVLDGERLETPVVNVLGALQLWTKDLCGQGPVDVATRDGRLGPFKALLPATKPQASAEEDMHY